MKEFKLYIDCSDIVWTLMFCWLAIDKNPIWWLAVLASIAYWFAPKRYREITIFSWRSKR